MNNARFLQLHLLTSYPASLLNRDDVGFAKRIPFGNGLRTRISSQCLKRHWRRYRGPDAISEAGARMSVRSRLIFEKRVADPLIKAGVDAENVARTTAAVIDVVLGKSAKAKASKDDAGGSLQTKQLIVLGEPEIEYIRAEVQALCDQSLDDKTLDKAVKDRFDRDARKNLDALRCSMGLDAALFGRMVTSDMLARTDAAVHVAHAFTVHAEQSESDYFTAVDDLALDEGDGTLGSAHINSSELTSGLYYGYINIDLPALVSNIEGCAAVDWLDADRALAAEVIRRLVHVTTKVSPGAKRGSTAPYAYAQAVIAEIGSDQPRTLANAFLRSVDVSGDLLRSTYEALSAHVVDLESMYGSRGETRVAALGPRDVLVGLGEQVYVARIFRTRGHAC